MTQPRYREGLQHLGKSRGTAGRGNAATGSDFNYSPAVTVTSGRDVEIKFFAVMNDLFREQAGGESTREAANYYAEPGSRIYYQNIVLKQ